MDDTTSEKHAPPPDTAAGNVPWGSYWSATREPLYSLVFLLPLILFYEAGSFFIREAVGYERQLVAHKLVQRLAAWFGTDAAWIPGIALVVTLTIWHVQKRAAWRIEPRFLLAMGAESLALTIPLFVFGNVLLEAGGVGGGAIWQRIVLAIGAGVYEELVFRLALIALLIWMLHDWLRTPKRLAWPIAVALAAVLFAICHVRPIGSEAFVWSAFLLRAVAGAYLAVVLVTRGLGIATGCHAAFNVILVLARGV